MQLVDVEVRRIIDECYTAAKQTLTTHRAKLDALTSALLEHETLDEIDAYTAAGLDRASEAANQWDATHN